MASSIPHSTLIIERRDALVEAAIESMREAFAITNSGQDYQAVQTLKACRRAEVTAAIDAERLARVRSA